MRQPRNTERHAPKPIPARPYDRGTLAAYIYDKVGVHLEDEAKVLRVENRMVEWMQRQPAWVQVLLVENAVSFELGARKNTGLPRDAAADADPERYHVRRMIGVMEDLENNLSHEVGHIIDAILIDQLYPHRRADRQQVEFFSDSSMSYKRAMGHDRSLPIERSRRGIRRGLRDHLASDIYKPAEYPCESFAHLFELYLMEHHKGRTEEQIDARMSEALPKLWVQFRDKMLPELLHVAGDMYERRRQHEHRRSSAQRADLEEVVEDAIEHWQMPPLRDHFLIRQLTGERCELWVERFQALSEAMPKDPYKRIYALFGAAYDSMDAMMEALHRNPALKREARRMVMNLEETLAEKGIEGFVRGCMDVERAMDRAGKPERGR